MGEDVGVSEGNLREEGGGTEEAEGGDEEGGRRGARKDPHGTEELGVEMTVRRAT